METLLHQSNYVESVSGYIPPWKRTPGSDIRNTKDNKLTNVLTWRFQEGPLYKNTGQGLGKLWTGLGRAKAMALLSTHMRWRKAFVRVDSAASKVILEKSWVSSQLISVLRLQKLSYQQYPKESHFRDTKKGACLTLGCHVDGWKDFDGINGKGNN